MTKSLIFIVLRRYCISFATYLNRDDKLCRGYCDHVQFEQKFSTTTKITLRTEKIYLYRHKTFGINSDCF